MRRLTLAVALAWVTATWLVGAQLPASLPAQSGSVKFAVIGDSGTGAPAQYDIGTRMAEARRTFPFEFVIMLGDNIYGRQERQDFVARFQRPFASLLDAGILFYASLGNHDDADADRLYPPFNMDGQRYYTYSKGNARFFALDSNAVDTRQLAWLDNALKQSTDGWKICYFHHPLYSNARRHGSDVELRVALEPLFLAHGVNIVFSGHDHTYERIRPQKGITYFVSGSAGELRRGDVRPSTSTAAYFDQDQSFMLVEIDGGNLIFQSRSRTGQTVDSGVIRLPTERLTR